MLYHAQGRYAEAEPLVKRALAIRENALGRNHPDVATGPLNILAWLALAQRDWAQAADYWRRGAEIMMRRVERGLIGPEGEATKGETVCDAARLGVRLDDGAGVELQIPDRRRAATSRAARLGVRSRGRARP
jgi:hypothetical protein